MPHFHVEGPGFRCSIGILTLEVIVGTVPADVLNAALVWARSNQKPLMAKWRELNA